MKKDRFVKLINELVSIKRAEDKLREALEEFEPFISSFGFFRHEDLVVDALKEAMNDKNEWIEYWLYELDCGKLSNKLKVTKNGKTVPMKTAGDLYECIKSKK